MFKDEAWGACAPHEEDRIDDGEACARWITPEEDAGDWACAENGRRIAVMRGAPIRPGPDIADFARHERAMGRGAAWPGDAAPLTRRLSPTALAAFRDGRVDAIGDVHGESDALEALLADLGWRIVDGRDGARRPIHPEERALLLLGDLVARGPDSAGVLRLAAGMIEAGDGVCLIGNHDWQALSLLEGFTPPWMGGRDLESLSQSLAGQPSTFLDRIAAALLRCPTEIAWTVRRGGAARRVIAAHAAPGSAADMVDPCLRAGVEPALLARFTRLFGAIARIAAYEGDAPIGAGPIVPVMRRDWRAPKPQGRSSARENPIAIHGHHVMRRPRTRGGAVGIDGGLGFGGRAVALRLDRLLAGLPACRLGAGPDGLRFAA